MDVLATMLLVDEIMPFQLVSKGAAETLLFSTVDVVVTMLPLGEIMPFPMVSEEAAEMTWVLVAALLVVARSWTQLCPCSVDSH